MKHVFVALNSFNKYFFQLVAIAILNVRLIKCVWIENAGILAELTILVVQMLNVVHNFTKLFALASQKLRATPIMNVFHMNVWSILIVQLHWNVEMKNVLILVNVPNMQNALQEIIREFVHVCQITPEILMA